MKVSVRFLRSVLPDWEWRAVQTGFGRWEYVGARLWEEVIVRPYAVLCGPMEDDAVTQWRADSGKESELFSAFWLRHANAVDEKVFGKEGAK